MTTKTGQRGGVSSSSAFPGRSLGFTVIGEIFVYVTVC